MEKQLKPKLSTTEIQNKHACYFIKICTQCIKKRYTVIKTLSE